MYGTYITGTWKVFDCINAISSLITTKFSVTKFFYLVFSVGEKKSNVIWTTKMQKEPKQILDIPKL